MNVSKLEKYTPEIADQVRQLLIQLSRSGKDRGEIPKEWFEVIMSSKDSLGEVIYEDDLLDKDTLLSLVNEAYCFFYKGTRYSASDRITDRYNLKG